MEFYFHIDLESMFSFAVMVTLWTVLLSEGKLLRFIAWSAIWCFATPVQPFVQDMVEYMISLGALETLYIHLTKKELR